MRINVDLCEELGVTIYSFPMKYHPISNPAYFKNRDYLGEHWNRKFIRTVQAVLNSTKGKIGKGVEFFDEAFGRNLANEWWIKLCSLSAEKLEIAKSIISLNKFKKEIMNVQIKKFLMYCHIIALHEILQKEIPKEVYIGVGEPKC